MLSQHCCNPQVLSPEEQTLAASNDYNFDHPDAFDFDLLTHTLRKLKQGKSVKIPVYDFTTHGRQKEWVRMNAHIQTHGIELRELMSSMSEILDIISVSRLPKRVLISLARGLESHCKSATPDGHWQTIIVNSVYWFLYFSIH